LQALKEAHAAEEARLRQVSEAKEREMHEKEAALRAEAAAALSAKESEMTEAERGAADKLAAELEAAAEAAAAARQAVADAAAREQAEMAAAREAALQDSQHRHEEEVARLQAAAAETAERLREEGSRAVAEARRTAAEEAAAAAARAAAAAEAMKEAHGREVAGLRGEIGQLQSTMASMQSELDGLKTANAQTMAALQSTQKGLAEKSADITALRAAHETEMADAAEEAEHMRDAMADKHAAATEALVAAHGEAMRAAEERFSELEHKFTVLTKRFNARESREDDVARIKELTALVAQQQKDVVYYKEAMEKMKAEILLREDNYNNTFANGGAGKSVLNVGKAMNATNVQMDWMLKRKNSSKAGGGKDPSSARLGSGR